MALWACHRLKELSISSAFTQFFISWQPQPTDWDLEDAFFLYQGEKYEDNEGDYILRMFQFSKGLTKCWLVISCFPQIELSSENMDIELLASISNILIGELIDVFVRD